MTHYAQYNQDTLVGDVLFKGRRGVFVDVGARDGKFISNTRYLEESCGWTGIAIEPHPELFAQLQATRNCECINIAASEITESGLEFVRFLEEPFGNSGLLCTFTDPERLTNIKHDIISIPTFPLSDILKNVSIIHYLDIDVEGHELNVLKGINKQGNPPALPGRLPPFDV